MTFSNMSTKTKIDNIKKERAGGFPLLSAAARQVKCRASGYRHILKGTASDPNNWVKIPPSKAIKEAGDLVLHYGRFLGKHHRRLYLAVAKAIKADGFPNFDQADTSDQSDKQPHHTINQP
jgi:hypothetical protein